MKNAPQNRLAVNEIFFSLQGESTHMGRPCTFIRLRGCPLRCNYCDTEYAFHEGEAMSFDDIMAKVQKYPTQLVELTGGEPLAQAAAKDFLKRLANEGYEVLLETSGALSVENIDPRVTIIMDLKTPSSGESSRNLLSNLDTLKPGKDEIKFVLKTQEDFAFAEKLSADFRLHDRFTVLMSPAFGELENLELAQWILKSGKPYRMQFQAHKYIWEPEQRGV